MAGAVDASGTVVGGSSAKLVESQVVLPLFPPTAALTGSGSAEDEDKEAPRQKKSIVLQTPPLDLKPPWRRFQEIYST